MAPRTCAASVKRMDNNLLAEWLRRCHFIHKRMVFTGDQNNQESRKAGRAVLFRPVSAVGAGVPGHGSLPGLDFPPSSPF